MFKAAGQAQFDKLFEKATSNLLLEPDWTSILQICDLIRQKDCPSKYAIAAIKKKIMQPNPHVSMFALQCLESVVKNCGSLVHDEVATKQFMEELREIAKTSAHENVREKVMELVQAWAHAFRKCPNYRAVQDVLNIMKAEGCKFPPLIEADAMFVSDTAPEWADSNTCHRCRTEFSLITRKHHCRACGQVFCGKCSSKTATLPKFGIEKEVRVCDACYDRLARDGSGFQDTDEMVMKPSGGPPVQQPSAQQISSPRKKTEEELQEEEQLQLAIAISQSEAEAKEREKQQSWYKVNPAPANEETVPSLPQSSPVHSSAPAIESEDPELSRYLNRNYWENRQAAKDEGAKEVSQPVKTGPSKQEATTTSAVLPSSSQFHPSAPFSEVKEKNELESGEIGTFVESLRVQIETFVTRMKSNSSRGRHIANDTAVQSLFVNITALHSQLLKFIQTQDNARTYYEGLQDKISQIRDARAALDALREQHKERQRLKAEEEERAKRFHMAQMLQVKRQQKQDYLEYQRQLTLQRMQEQEREMQMRIEQQKQQLTQQGHFGMYPPGPNMPGYPVQHLPQNAYAPGGLPPNTHQMPHSHHQGFGNTMPHQYMVPGSMPQQNMHGMPPQQLPPSHMMPPGGHHPALQHVPNPVHGHMPNHPNMPTHMPNQQNVMPGPGQQPNQPVHPGYPIVPNGQMQPPINHTNHIPPQNIPPGAPQFSANQPGMMPQPHPMAQPPVDQVPAGPAPPVKPEPVTGELISFD